MFNGSEFAVPIAATMDLQYRLPPFQEIIYSPTIAISLALLAAAIVFLIVISYRSSRAARRLKRLEDMALAKSILLKRGGAEEDWAAVNDTLDDNPKIDPGQIAMVKDVFQARFRPLLAKRYGNDFAERLEMCFFPPPKDTKAIVKPTDLKKLVDASKTESSNQAAAILDLMDATIKPGILMKITFEGVRGVYDCLAMNHNMQCLNVTLPADSASRLAAELKPGTVAEGNFESGPSLIAFTAAVERVLSGQMPYCRLSSWRNAWEIRTRESVRLPVSIPIDFQHVSTSSSGNISMAALERGVENGRAGEILDISLGGCRIGTTAGDAFLPGDLVRFNVSLMRGQPPATLLGSIVDVDRAAEPAGSQPGRGLHVQFLALDDVSQRLLARAVRFHQEGTARDEWLRAQAMTQRIRQNRIDLDAEPDSSAPPAAMPGRSPSASVRAASGRQIRTGEGERGQTRTVGKPDQPAG